MNERKKSTAANRHKSSARRPANRFLAGAKISEYQFKRVLWSFVLDQPVAEAAKRIDLSTNSINALYGKLRVFFTEVGIFEDIYEGRDPREGTAKGEAFEGFEYRLIPFHIARINAKRRVPRTSVDTIDYHWNESYWRFHYSVLTEGRPPSDFIHRMMYSHLLAFVRHFGPIGKPSRNFDAAARLKRNQFNQRLIWLERNSTIFSHDNARSALRELRELKVSTEPYARENPEAN